MQFRKEWPQIPPQHEVIPTSNRNAVTMTASQETSY